MHAHLGKHWYWYVGGYLLLAYFVNRNAAAPSAPLPLDLIGGFTGQNPQWLAGTIL